MSKITKRGYEQEDEKFFNTEGINKLQIAHEEVKWLFDRGYKLKSIVEFIGNHHLLSIRQRHALLRGTTSTKQCESRFLRLLPLSNLNEGTIYIDGFNLIITLEVAISKGTLILGDDNVIRDLAGLRGTYTIIDKTDLAIDMIFKTLSKYKTPKVIILLDAPVSNSGRLKSKLHELSIDYDFKLEVELVPNADAILSRMPRIVTSDAIILDNCSEWFNLSSSIIEEFNIDCTIVRI